MSGIGRASAIWTGRVGGRPSCPKEIERWADRILVSVARCFFDITTLVSPNRIYEQNERRSDARGFI